MPATIDLSHLKLGKQPAKVDPRTFKLARYMIELPKIPATCCWSRKVPSWPMYKNDQIGDCTVAGAAHQQQCWTANADKEICPTERQVISAYRAITGYDPKKPETDQGAALLDVMKYWRKTGIARHKIGAFAEVDADNIALFKAAVYLFGGAYLGLQLPLSAQTQKVWDVTSTSGKGAKGSWGGHCVIITDADPSGFTCITWGAKQKMTRKFLATYCDEAYAIISRDFLHDGKAPNGFDIEALTADLSQVSKA